VTALSSKKAILERAEQLRGERLNETGRTCIDLWATYSIESMANRKRDAAASARFADAANKYLRAAFQADKQEDARNLAHLRNFQEQKQEASGDVRAIH